ncbi:MAG: exosome complex RNA-binding protein Rrp4 [Nanoarchaeota archaeon]|nr:exosome complex RNA-binding protein Rrp4 [Nanoarchaeota archaeon]
MSKILIEQKQIVIPGEIIAEGMDFLPGKGAFREDDKVISSRIGWANVNGSIISIIPLSGSYLPRNNDNVIGYVKDMTSSVWFIDIGYAYEAVLGLKEASSEYIERGASLSDFFAVGDIVIAKVKNVTKDNNTDLTMVGPGLRKIRGGKVIEITPAKVPRVVGKQGSMISMIKELTGCTVFAGQNGRVWIRGPSPEAEILATNAIYLIDERAHTSGLTEYIKQFLESNNKGIMESNVK